MSWNIPVMVQFLSFPGGSPSKKSAILMQGTWVQSLTQELDLACHS